MKSVLRGMPEKNIVLRKKLKLSYGHGKLYPPPYTRESREQVTSLHLTPAAKNR